MQSGTVFSLGGFSLRHLKPHRLSQVESMGHFFSNLRCCSSTAADRCSFFGVSCDLTISCALLCPYICGKLQGFQDIDRREEKSLE